MLSRTRWERASSMPTTRSYSTRRSRTSSTMNLTTCHRKPAQFRPRVLAIASIGRLVGSGLDLADEDERAHQRVDRDSFGEAEADEQRHEDRADDLRIATDRFHGLAHAVADADAWA